MSIQSDLKAARELIASQRHWGQGSYSDGEGHLCALGAVNKAVIGAAWFCTPACDNARMALVRALPSIYWRKRGVAAFNDSRKRTHAEVLALFDRAIAKASA